MAERKASRLLVLVRSRVASRDMAEDIVQSLLLKALRAEDDIGSPGRAKAWFYRVLGKRVIRCLSQVCGGSPDLRRRIGHRVVRTGSASRQNICLCRPRTDMCASR